MNFSDRNEAERRRKIAEEKMWGAIIENIERIRKRPVAFSIISRLYLFYQYINEFLKVVKAVERKVDPLRTPAPSFTKEQTNLLIETYNSIIEDIHSHFRKKDAYIKKFSTLEKLDTPTINDIAKTLYLMGINSSQIMCYMIRWK